jgi:radical SAM protein with 4Fe4S-binding SPASM domain
MIVNFYEKKDTKSLKQRAISLVEKRFPRFFEHYLVPIRTRKKDREAKEPIRAAINKILQEKTFPLFQKIEIETVNRCNNTCSFCPVNKKDDPRTFRKMDESLFLSIIQQLKELDYRGAIALFSNNEALLDDRIFRFVAHAKAELPHAFHYLYTNATLLDVPKFKELMTHLDKIVLDNYHDGYKFIKPVREVFEFCKEHPEYQDRVEIHIRRKTEFLTTRGGAAKNRSMIKTIESSCVLPFSQLIVRPDGKISLCCNDALGAETLGDLTQQSLTEVWMGEKYQEVRSKLTQKNGRALIGTCAGCDALSAEVNLNDLKNRKIPMPADVSKYY